MTQARLIGCMVNNFCTTDANLAGIHTPASRAERVELLPLPNKHFRATGCDLCRVTNDDRLEGSSFCGFDV